MEAPKKTNGMGTWRRYKLGQAQFTSWLKQTAEKLVSRKPKPDAGANETETTEQTEDAAPQKSRRQKKKAKAAGIDFTAAITGTDKFVHWSELEVLAQRIADNAQPEDIPEAALNILRDVVGLRKKSFQFFTAAAKDSKDQKVKQSNAAHAHIIAVLERVLSKLETLVKSGASRQRRSEQKDDSRVTTSDLSNLFALLEVQTAPDGADGAADEASADEAQDDTALSVVDARPQKGGKKKAGNKAQKLRKPDKMTDRAVAKTKKAWVDSINFGEIREEDEEDEFDLYMMVYCFFEDFNTIRNHVRERWCDYWYDRSVPLDTLAVITHAAFELFYQLQRDLNKELRMRGPELMKYEWMMNMLFIEFGIEHIDYDSYDDLDEEESNERIWRDESDWLALSSYWTLGKTMKFIPPGKVPMIPPSQRPPTVYGANKLDDWRTFECRVTQDLVTEAAHVKALKKNGQEHFQLPSETTLLFGIQECLKWKDFDSALIFSLHLWVDIRNIIETEHVKPFEQLQITAAQLKDALERHHPIKYCKNRDLKDRWTGRIWETNHFMLEDFQFADKKARFRQMGVDEDPEPFFLLKHEPVWAGLLNFRARLVYSQLGHEFVVLSGVVDAAAYVYHAALAMDPSLPRWKEMDRYVATHTEHSQFKRGLQAQQGPAAIIRNFERLPAIDREKGNVADQIVDRIWDAKTFVPEVFVRKGLYYRYAFEEQHTPFVHYFQELVAEQYRRIEDSGQEEVQVAQSLLDSNRQAGSNHDGNSNGESMALSKRSKGANNDRAVEELERWLERKRELSQLSPVEMLRRLDETVTSQLDGLLTLDYFKLFDLSLPLLGMVVASFGEGNKYQALLGPSEDEMVAHLDRLPTVLGRDLEECAGTAKEREILDNVVGACKRFLPKMDSILELSASANRLGLAEGPAEEGQMSPTPKGV
ncbi:hypothetical protein C8A03DRAFT_35065 [Achaetomium macrosporum]|uniref:DUF6604 domain-containing protein n=1 Tax=Achaetomium macrosporum TaxID=79813 RepID=A0AAN7C8T3_9PEZI|nr:hypothetical protein C8A03DRAFT_35065 [Achaetomium macrosporum]